VGQLRRVAPVTLTDEQLNQHRERVGPGEHRLDCQWCGVRFTAKRSHARYCSRECRQSAYRGRNRLTTLTINLDVATAMVLEVIAAENNMSRQDIVAELIGQLVDQVTDTTGP
jgi:hypothetical protein